MFFNVILFLTVCVSCSGSQNNNIEYQEENNSFIIPSENLEYVVPTDISQWAVAAPEVLPDGIIFFGVDRENEICVGIFKHQISFRSTYGVNDISDAECKELLKSVCESDASLDVLSEDVLLADTTYSSMAAKRFLVSKNVVSRDNINDTISVYYNGYLFDNIGKTYGIVVISEDNPFKYSGCNNTKVYLDALKIKID